MNGRKGRCRDCKRWTTVFTAQRFGGGTYRRGGRYYWSSICLPCARSHVERDPNRSSMSRWAGSTLRRIVEGANQ